MSKPICNSKSSSPVANVYEKGSALKKRMKSKVKIGKNL